MSGFDSVMDAKLSLLATERMQADETFNTQLLALQRFAREELVNSEKLRANGISTVVQEYGFTLLKGNKQTHFFVVHKLSELLGLGPKLPIGFAPFAGRENLTTEQLVEYVSNYLKAEKWIAS
jgi:hypothetical protein